MVELAESQAGKQLGHNIDVGDSGKLVDDVVGDADFADVGVGSVLRAENTVTTGVEDVVANNLVERSYLGSSSGHKYAAEVLDGGTGTAFAGHGQLPLGSGKVVVPEGAAITLPRETHSNS
ncbi:hypothetical protein P4S72_16550 [Vibrio sp. PP-XX7]